MTDANHMSRAINHCLNHKPARFYLSGWFCCFFASFLIIDVALADDTYSNVAKQTLDDAVNLRKEGRIEDSIELLEKLKKADQDNVRIHLELAIGYLKNRQYQQAEAAVEQVFKLAPAMKDNKKLQQMISHSQQQAQMLGMPNKVPNNTANKAVNKQAVNKVSKSSPHQFKGEVTLYKGFDRQAASFSFFEISFDEEGDDFQIERKEFSGSDTAHYTSGKFKGQYRYIPSESFDLLGQPTYAIWRSQLSWFQKNSKRDKTYRLGLATFDSSFHLVQPKRLALNARYRAKWRYFQGDKVRFDQTTDINFVVPYQQLKLKLGFSQKTRDYNSEFSHYENSTTLTPYMSLSYRFSPTLMAKIGLRERRINADNELLEGEVNHYFGAMEYDFTEDLSLSLSYYYDDLTYNIVDLDFGFNSGQLKRTLTLGGRYQLSENWQIGLNAIYIDRKQNEDFGQDQLKRLETSIRFSF